MQYHFHLIRTNGQLDDERGTFFDNLEQASEHARSMLNGLVTHALIYGGQGTAVRGVAVCSSEAQVLTILLDPAVERAMVARSTRTPG